MHGKYIKFNMWRAFDLYMLSTYVSVPVYVHAQIIFIYHKQETVCTAYRFFACFVSKLVSGVVVEYEKM